MHAELVELVLQCFKNDLFRLVRPVGHDLGDCIVAERVAYQVHDVFRDAAHQALLLVGILGLGDQNFDDAETISVEAELNKMLGDLNEHKARLLIEPAAQQFLDDMRALQID